MEKLPNAGNLQNRCLHDSDASAMCSLSLVASTTRAPFPPKSWRKKIHLFQLNLVGLLVPKFSWVLQGQYRGEPKHVYYLYYVQQNKTFLNGLCGHMRANINSITTIHVCVFVCVCMFPCMLMVSVVPLGYSFGKPRCKFI